MCQHDLNLDIGQKNVLTSYSKENVLLITFIYYYYITYYKIDY